MNEWFLWDGKFAVVETDDNAYIGTVEIINDDQIRVLSGYRGRPPIIDSVDVHDIMSAEQPFRSSLVDA